MTIGTHATHFADQPIGDWNTEMESLDTNTTVYRIAVDSWESEATWTEAFARFLNIPEAQHTTGLVIGSWDFSRQDSSDAQQIVEAICSAYKKLPNLTAIFFGDITYDEYEISWIQQTDVSPFFEAYPALEIFRVRGGSGLRLGQLDHDKLKTLIIETGGLDRTVVRDALASHLPNLEHLELWLGSDSYGATSTLEDFTTLFSGQLFPKLRYLGLRNCEFSDAIAIAITQSPLIERLEVLDLSLGTLGDEGAQALLDCPATRKLKKLDLHHHYCTDEMVARLQVPPMKVDVSQQLRADTYDDGESNRYVSVSE